MPNSHYPTIYFRLIPVKKYLTNAFKAGLAGYSPKKTGINLKQLVSDWLKALFKDLNDIKKDPQELQTWAWQMALSMAVDLRSHTKTVHQYLALLENLEYEKLKNKPADSTDTNLAHLLFWAAAAKAADCESCHSSSSYEKEPIQPIQYVRIVSLFDYLQFLLRATTPGKTHIDSVKVNDLLKARQNLSPDELDELDLETSAYLNLPTTDNPVEIDIEAIRDERLPKPDAELAGGGALRLNWVMPYNEFQQLLNPPGPDDTITDIVNGTTGRPVQEDQDLCTQFQVYIVIPRSHQPPAFQPWAGVANWSGMYPYLSYKKLDGFGRAYNIRNGATSGNPSPGARERVLMPISLPRGSTATLLPDKPKCIPCHRLPVLTEACDRFDEAMRLPGPDFVVN